MVYLSKGAGTINDEAVAARTLIRASDIEFTDTANSQFIVIYENA